MKVIYVHDEPRGECDQSAPQVVLAVHCLHGWNPKIEHEQGHGDSKYAVA